MLKRDPFVVFSILLLILSCPAGSHAGTFTDISGNVLDLYDIYGDLHPYAGFVGPGEDLSDADLTNASLENADLTGANLSRANFTDVNLSGALLVNANLSNADLVYSYLFETDLSNADLTDAYIYGVQSGGIAGTPVNLSVDWQLFNGYLVGLSANLSNADLTGVDLSGKSFNEANFAGANLSNAKLEYTSFNNVSLINVSFANADLIYADLIDVDLSGADLTNADLAGAVLQRVSLSNANLEGTSLEYTTLGAGVSSGGIVGVPFGLPSFVQLVDGYLTGLQMNLSGAELSGSDLSGASLPEVDLSYADLSNSDLTDANLFMADLTGADLTGANLSGANLTSATLTGAILANANLENPASLKLVRTGGITGTPFDLPVDWQLSNGYLIGPEADLTNANLSYSELINANLTDANLEGSNLAGANLSGANLTSAMLADPPAYLAGVISGGIIGIPELPASWNLVGGYLIGPGANLTNADFSELNLNGLDLRYAILTGVTSGGIVGSPTHLPENWQILSGYLIGPGANLSNANLSGAGLLNANLTGANLSNADLTDIDLTNADLTNADLTGADLSNASLPGTELVVATLTNAILSSADLRFADLSGADLTGANLDGTQVQGTIVVEATGDTLVDRVNSAETMLEATTLELVETQDQLADALAQTGTGYTLSEIADLRPGSTMIEVIDGQATIEMRLEQSGDLIEWIDTGESSSITVPIPDAEVKWYRFAGPE